MKQVFVLGAGFSKSYAEEMPVLKDFKRRIIEVKTNQTSYPELSNFAENYYRLSNRFEDIRNIEFLATVILSKNIFVNHEEQFKYLKLKHEVLKFIKDMIFDVPELSPNNDFLLRQFLLNVRAKQATIISFNYDLLIERAIRQSQTNIHLDYAGLTSYPHHNPRFHQSVPIELIKLHGSLNWFKVKGSESISLDTVKIVNENDPFSGIHKHDIPVYIPMTHAKDSFLTGSLYSTLWARAIEKLEQATEIHFIGYGFPATDSNHLFAFLDFKTKIKSIVVYNSSERKRLSKIFGEGVVFESDAKDFLARLQGDDSNLFGLTPFDE